jgi:hypothetical protein
MGQVRTLARKLVLRELLPSEVLEIRIIDLALTDAFVRQHLTVFLTSASFGDATAAVLPDHLAQYVPQTGSS